VNTITRRPGQRFARLLRSFETAVLVSPTREWQLRARPLRIASVADDGDVWFVTGHEAGKSVETSSDRKVTVLMQSAKQVVSITGTAELIVDKEALRALWNESWRPWFPNGPDDELALLHVRATDAEFWDMEELRGFVYLFHAVRQSVRDAEPIAEPMSRRDVQNEDDDDRPTLTGFLKSHLHVSSRRARSSDQSLEFSNSAETVRPLESNAGDTEQTPNG
jgi:general stress protein 26